MRTTLLTQLFVLAMTALTLHSCAWMPKQGDILFVSAGQGSMSKAIVDATATADTMQFDHVAVFTGSRRHPIVVEASPSKGVVATSWEDFAGQADRCIVVKRLTADYPKKDAIARVMAHVGQPYDWSYMPGNGKTYCSELVEESYLYADSTRIFPSKPMRFRADDGSMPQFWTDLFNRLGEPVPEGVPGTNPNDMARCPLLRTVRTVCR